MLELESGKTYRDGFGKVHFISPNTDTDRIHWLQHGDTFTKHGIYDLDVLRSKHDLVTEFILGESHALT